MKSKSLLVLSLLPLLASCNVGGSSNSGEESKTITDMQGREVTYKESDTQRVICLGAGALRYYSYIGDIGKIVAVEEIDKQPFGVGTALRPYYHVNKDYFSGLPTCGKGGPAAQTPDKEAIVSVNPSMIISFYSDSKVNDDLSSSLQVPVIALSQGGDGIFDETTLKSLELLGKVFNKESRYQELSSYINTCKEELSSLTVDEEETYYAGCIGNWGKTNLLGSMYNFPVFKYAKVKNALDDLEEQGRGQVTVDMEKLVSLDPDKIFLDGSGVAGFIDAYKADSTVYDSLTAFSSGEIYMLLPYNAYYTNLEIQLMSTYYVASLAHSEAFADFSMEEKANEISMKFLKKECYSEYLEYTTAYGGYTKVDLGELLK